MSRLTHESERKVATVLDAVIRDAGLNLTWQCAPPAMRSARDGESSDAALAIVFRGPDTGLLLARDAELLLALEHVAAKALRLEPEQHHCISFDAGDFKLRRERALKASAEAAVVHVRETGQPFRFAPMSSRERRLLHLALASSGLESRSEGEGATRSLVLHPPFSH